MAATVRRRLVRRRWLGLPIGMYMYPGRRPGVHADRHVLVATFLGWSFTPVPRPSSTVVSGRGDGARGLALGVVGVGRFGLDDAQRRSRFLRRSARPGGHGWPGPVRGEGTPVSSLVVVRHGRTAANGGGCCSDARRGPGSDARTTPGGRTGRGDRVERTDPDGGVQSVASGGGDRRGVPLPVRVIDERASSRSTYGDWDSRPLSEVPPEFWSEWRSDLDFSPTAGESCTAWRRGSTRRAGTGPLRPGTDRWSSPPTCRRSRRLSAGRSVRT